MAKISKKSAEKRTKSISRTNSTQKKKKNQYKLKQSFVKLFRKDNLLNRSEKEEEGLPRTSVIEHNVDIKIRKNILSIGQNKIKFDSVVENQIGISLSIKLDGAIVECCTIDQPVKPNASKTLNQLIESAWRRCKQGSKHEAFSDSQIVFAKMKGYQPWPSVIREIKLKGKRAKVFFFGTSNTGTVDTAEIVRFEMTTEVIKLLLLRPLNFFFESCMRSRICLGNR